jgi:hypothetical protein
MATLSSIVETLKSFLGPVKASLVIPNVGVAAYLVRSDGTTERRHIAGPVVMADIEASVNAVFGRPKDAQLFRMGTQDGAIGKP